MSKQIPTAIQWGLIGGFAMAIFRLLIYFISPLSISSWENVFYVPLLFCMVWGVVTIKRSGGGEMTFAQAFGYTFLIAITGVCINTLMYYILLWWIDPDLRDKGYRLAMQLQEEKWEKSGMTDEQIETSKKWVSWALSFPWVIVILLVYQTVVSVIISLIIAAFAKQSGNKTTVFTEQNPTP